VDVKPRRFQGRRILVTGASSGIGRALAERLAGEGADVVVSARNEAELQITATRCRAVGGRAWVIPADVTREEECRRLVAATLSALGGLDVLVNNAGLTMLARFEEVKDLSAYERIVKVNYLGAVYCTHAALPHLKASRGQVVAVSSLSGLIGVPTRTAYVASKHALQGFCDALRIELANSGVSVLVVSPGFIKTDMRQSALGADGQPLGFDPRPERKAMTLERCVALIVGAMAKRRRELVMTASGKLARWVQLIWPGLVDRLAARATRGDASLGRKD
jgi:NAD(P)-dependent dehydrogenase (short-subunit alcohol dehydrogenase family)